MTAGELAFDGWFGALVGALIGGVVAWFILAKTIKHNMTALERQAGEQRKILAEQLQTERDIAVWHRQVETFGDLTTAVSALVVGKHGKDEIRARLDRAYGSAHRWAMYMTDESDVFATGVVELVNGLGRAVVLEAARTASRGEAPEFLIVTDALGYVGQLLAEGRAWHDAMRPPVREDKAQARARAESWALTAATEVDKMWPVDAREAPR